MKRPTEKERVDAISKAAQNMPFRASTRTPIGPMLLADPLIPYVDDLEAQLADVEEAKNHWIEEYEDCAKRILLASAKIAEQEKEIERLKLEHPLSIEAISELVTEIASLKSLNAEMLQKL